MSLKEVKSEILEEAQQKADEIIDEAEQQREEILEEARQEAEAVKEEYEEELEGEKDSYETKTISNARMKAKEKRLKAKQAKIDEVFENFRESLEDLTKKEREDFVEKCLDKVEFEPEKVIGGEEFEDAVSIDFEEEDIEGIVVVSKDGSRRQSFTFDKIVEEMKSKHRKEVAEKLFE
ncbi:MAG: hypothetical protein H8Z69_04995 [Nanohaloarchaea archaeon]|nr:hypothetical protein [Candidatus Nanohaloarchaea archaeon]